MTKKHLIYEENRGAQVGAPVGTNGEEIKGNLRCVAAPLEGAVRGTGEIFEFHISVSTKERALDKYKSPHYLSF